MKHDGAEPQIGDLDLTPGDPEVRREIERLCREVLAEPGNCLLRLELARALAKDGAWARAETVLRGCIELAGGKHLLAGVFFNLGVCRENAGDLEGAISAYEQSLFLEPSLVWARLRLGELFRSLGDQERAVAELKRAVLTDSENPEAEFALGQVLQEAGRLQEARAAYRRLIQQQPRHLRARRALAELESCIQ